MAKRRCTAKTKKGPRCKNRPVAGHEQCIGHLPRKVKESLGFAGPQPGSGRPRKPRVVDVMRERVEERLDEILAPYFEQLEGAVVHAKFQGGVFPSDVPDTGARIEAAEKLLDRVYGKPTQRTEIGGDVNKPVRISAELLTDPELRDGLRAVARRVAAARSGGPGGTRSSG